MTPVARLMSRLALAVLGALAATACRSSGAPDGDRANAASPRGSSRVITGEQIATWNVTNAFEALQHSGLLQTRYGRDGQPAAVTSRRGSPSGGNRAAEEPVVIVDGTRALNSKVLRDIPASAIVAIELLGTADGTTRYGTGVTAGAIVITTRNGSPDASP